MYDKVRKHALENLTSEVLSSPESFKAWFDRAIAIFNEPRPKTEVSKPSVVVYCDGACSGNPGPGGWGAVISMGDYRREYSGFVPEATNNRMELTAAIEALSALKKPCNVTLYSDASYLVTAFRKGWLSYWMDRGWRKSDGKPVENQDLWKQLAVLTERHDVTFIKVKGHADNEWNNRCDQLAVAAYKAAAKEVA